MTSTTKTRTFDVTIGDRETTVRLSPWHLDARDELASSLWDHYTDSVDAEKVALHRAVAKLWGATARWWADSGVRGMGQVTTPDRRQPGAHHCITDRIRAAVVER